MKRLKGQIQKWQQDPDTLIEYDRAIKDQLEKSIIEPVCDLEEEGKLFDLPHHPGIKKEEKLPNYGLFMMLQPRKVEKVYP